jgi:hypothetical protein
MAEDVHHTRRREQKGRAALEGRTTKEKTGGRKIK